jgi:predicted RNase H-like HicB family nuclease
MELNNAETVDFGKVFYLPPKLPDMSLIVFKKEGYYQAVCIDIEIDAVGKTVKEACKNLKQKLSAYIKQMVYNFDGNEKEAIQDIVRVAFSEGNLKSLLYTRYLQVKHQYIIDRVAKENKAKSRGELFIVFLRMVFPFQPIRFNLAMATGRV